MLAAARNVEGLHQLHPQHVSIKLYGAGHISTHHRNVVDTPYVKFLVHLNRLHDAGRQIARRQNLLVLPLRR